MTVAVRWPENVIVCCYTEHASHLELPRQVNAQQNQTDESRARGELACQNGGFWLVLSALVPHQPTHRSMREAYHRCCAGPRFDQWHASLEASKGAYQPIREQYAGAIRGVPNQWEGITTFLTILWGQLNFGSINCNMPVKPSSVQSFLVCISACQKWYYLRHNHNKIPILWFQFFPP